MKVNQYKYNLCVEEEKLEKFFKENKDIFINQGGDIERLFNEIKYNQCLRIFKDNITNVDIKLEDIENSINIFKKKYGDKLVIIHQSYVSNQFRYQELVFEVYY